MKIKKHKQQSFLEMFEEAEKSTAFKDEWIYLLEQEVELQNKEIYNILKDIKKIGKGNKEQFKDKIIDLLEKYKFRNYKYVE